MPPRPLLQSLLPVAAPGAGDSSILLAARRCLRTAAAGGRRIRMLHSFSGSHLPRRSEVTRCVRSDPVARFSGPFAVRSRNVPPAEDYMRTSEERPCKPIRIPNKQGIYPKQWNVGANQRMFCSMCNGGPTEQKSFSLFIRADSLQPDGDPKVRQAENSSENGTGRVVQAKQASERVYRKICERDLHLEPLCDELITYFSERMISIATLRRNNVIQRERKNKIVIAFTYRRDGILVACKYREVSKIFFQEKDTEKILYCLDDIKGARDVIIVEGEIDKLSMEEAGYRNCVGVPDGAPAKVSKKLPDKDQLSLRSVYVTRIILATDADPPGQALAEELARRLGKERCWRVKWPRKNETDICKDANEVVMFLGLRALKKVIEDAELYPVTGGQEGSLSSYGRTVQPANDHSKAYDERLGQLIEKLKNEGTDKIGNSQQMVCPTPDGVSKVSQANKC